MERAKLSELSDWWESRMLTIGKHGNDLCSMHERLADFLFCGKEKTDLGHEERVDKFCVCLGFAVRYETGKNKYGLQKM